MHIRHVNPATSTLGHDGNEWIAIRDGIFEVPDEIGYELLQHGVWTRYHGVPAYEVGGESEGDAEGDLLPPAASEVATLIDWRHEGREAAKRGDPRSVPPGVHPASREARLWRLGFDSAGAPPA